MQRMVGIIPGRRRGPEIRRHRTGGLVSSLLPRRCGHADESGGRPSGRSQEDKARHSAVTIPPPPRAAITIFRRLRWSGHGRDGLDDARFQRHRIDDLRSRQFQGELFREPTARGRIAVRQHDAARLGLHRELQQLVALGMPA